CNPTGLNVQDVVEIEARDGEDLQILDRGGFVPLAAAERRVFGLEGPGNERGESAGFFLKLAEMLEVVDAMLVALAYSEHHRRSGAHTQLVSSAVNIHPVLSQTLQARDTMTDFIIQDLRASSRDGIQAGVTQSNDRVANGEITVLGDGNNLGGRITMQMDFRKALLD